MCRSLRVWQCGRLPASCRVQSRWSRRRRAGAVAGWSMQGTNGTNRLFGTLISKSGRGAQTISTLGRGLAVRGRPVRWITARAVGSRACESLLHLKARPTVGTDETRFPIGAIRLTCAAVLRSCCSEDHIQMRVGYRLTYFTRRLLVHASRASVRRGPVHAAVPLHRGWLVILG